MMIRKKAVTLLELLIVVIIIGILASISLPVMTKTIEKATTAEVVANLNLIWAAEKDYFLDHNTFTDGMGELNIEVESHYFDYSIEGIIEWEEDGRIQRRARRVDEEVIMNNFIAIAQRRNNAPHPYNTYWYRISKDGIIYSNGPFFPNPPWVPGRG